MFSSISWSEYLVVIALLLSVYYLFIGAKFYSSELVSLVKGKRAVSISPNISGNEKLQDSVNHYQTNQSALFPSYQGYISQPEETDDTFEKVEELTTRLKEVIAHGASAELSKGEFILSLQSLLKNYHFLKGSPFFVAINNLIASECDKHGLVHLNAEERVMLWN